MKLKIFEISKQKMALFTKDIKTSFGNINSHIKRNANKENA